MIFSNSRRQKYMKKGLSQFFVRILDKNIRKEADSACVGFGYQPVMPEAAKKFKRKKKQ